LKFTTAKALEARKEGIITGIRIRGTERSLAILALRISLL